MSVNSIHWEFEGKSNYSLGTILAILVSGTRHWEQLTSWMCIQPFPSVVPICSNTAEQLTCWICVQPFSSVVLICSNTGEQLTRYMCSAIVIMCFLSAQTLESNSLAGCLALLISVSDLLNTVTEEQLTCWKHVKAYSLVVLIYSNIESDSHTGYIFSYSSQWFLFT